MWYCSECGKKNTGKFCTRCGTRYVEVDEEFAKENGADFEIPEEESADDENNRDIPEEVSPQTKASGSFFSRLKSALRFDKEDSEEAGEVEKSGETDDIEDAVGSVRETGQEPLPDTAYAEELLKAPEEVLASEKAELFPELQEAEAVPFFDEEAFVRKVREDNAGAAVDDECRSPFLNVTEAFCENGGNAFGIAGDSEKPGEEQCNPEANADILEHHQNREADSKSRRFNKRMLIIIGSLCGVVLLALFFLITSLFVTKAEIDGLPMESGVYYYVSGAEDTIHLYADKSITSDVLADLENGICVEYLAEINYRFDFVRVRGTGEYGYVLSEYLVDNIDKISYNDRENSYNEEKFLGYWYVTRTENGLTLWETPEGNGNQKATLQNGFKVSLLEKTSDKYWYVFDYNSAERGYVRSSYLTDKLSKVVGVYTEPTDKTVIGDMFVINVSTDVSLRSQPSAEYGSIRTKVKLNSKVGVIQKTTKNFWYVYDYASGKYGYVAVKYLSATDPQEAEKKKQEEERKKQEEAAHTVKVGDVAYVAGTDIGLAVHAEAAQSAAELGHLNNGDWITVLEDANSEFWLVQVRSTGTKGYVLKAYIKK